MTEDPPPATAATATPASPAAIPAALAPSALPRALLVVTDGRIDVYLESAADLAHIRARSARAVIVEAVVVADYRTADH